MNKIDEKIFIYLTGFAKNGVVYSDLLPAQTGMCAQLGIGSPKTLRAHLKSMAENNIIKVVDDNNYLLMSPYTEEYPLRIAPGVLSLFNNTLKSHVFNLYCYFGKHYQIDKNYIYSEEELLNIIKAGDDPGRVLKHSIEVLEAFDLIDYKDGKLLTFNTMI